MNGISALLAAVAVLAASAGPVTAQTREAAVLPKVGGEFPAFSLPDVTGKQVSLKDFKGKAIILSFWSCHTDTCYTSVRVLEDLLRQYSSRGLVAPTICSEVPLALEKNGYSGLRQRCGTGQIILIDKDRALTNKLGITEFPTTYLIDRNYAVWQIIPGTIPLMGEDFRSLVKSLVSE